MKANELRIGNLVYDPFDHCSVSILDIDFIAEHLKTFKPIPLTEEWLLKFGFVKGESHETGAIYYNYDIDDKRYHVKMYNGKATFDIDWLIPCEYVHQLQNLFFALTGTELAIQE